MGPGLKQILKMGLAQGPGWDLGKEVKQGLGWDGAQVRDWRGGLSWDLDLGIRWDPGGNWNRFGKRGEGGVGGQGPERDRTRGRDKG